MTTFSGSHKNLWQYISSNWSSTRPPEIIKEEMTKYEKYLAGGLTVYKSATSHMREESLSKIKKDKKRDFIRKLSSHLGDLDVEICLELFNSFLLHEFKGTIEDMKVGLDDERYTQKLLHEFSVFYRSERIYLLRCIKHILCCWQIDDHGHKDVYSDFMDRQNNLQRTILDQYDYVIQAPAPSVGTTHSMGSIDHRQQNWMIGNLKEQCELLEIMLLYYKDAEKTPRDICNLLDKFKKQGFGRHQTNKHLVEANMAALVSRIGHLQSLIILECFDLELLLQCVETDNLSEHPLIGNSFKMLDDIIQTLGDVADHCPITLAWMVFRHVTGCDVPVTRRLGNGALQMDVFGYMTQILNSQPFSGKTLVANLARYILYSLLTILLTVFVESSLGNPERVSEFVCQLVKEPFISEEVWMKGIDEGIGTLVKSSWSRMVDSVNPCLKLCTALATDSATSAMHVYKLLNDPVVGTNVNGWQFIIDELELCQQTFEYSAGFLKTSILNRLQVMMNLVAALLNSCRQLPHDRKQEVNKRVEDVVQAAYTAVQRMSMFVNPPVDTIRTCLYVLVAEANVQPESVWSDLRQMNFLPFLTENLTDVVEACSGSGINYGQAGQLLAASEIPHGTFPITTAFLDLLLSLMPSRDGDYDDTSLATVAMIPCLVYVIREVFPTFRKWRFYHVGRREIIGQKCLDLFHRALSLTPEHKDLSSVTPRNIVYYSLLYTESGRTLLDIIGTGADMVDLALAQQGSIEEGIGVDLTRQIRLAFSVLNQLMVLRPGSEPPSPIEGSLFALPVGPHQRHLVVTVAEYIYLRHDARLPTMATLLLKRLALLSPMSLMACMGTEGSVIRNVFTSRLQSYTEDVRLRVVILELLTTCVDVQPGLIEHFLNIKLKPDTSAAAGKNSGDADNKEIKEKKLVMCETSCLKAVISLLKENKEGSAHCPSELLCAVTEFLHALWYGQRSTAMELLRQTPDFWQNLLVMFMVDLPEPERSKDLTFCSDLKTLAYVIRILSSELYTVSGKVDNNLKIVVEAIVRENRIPKTSKYIKSVLSVYRPVGEVCEVADDIGDENGWSEHSCVELLYGWRQLLVLLAGDKIGILTVESRDRDVIMADILDALRSQLALNLSKSRLRLISVLANLQFILIQHWKSDVANLGAMMNKLTMVTNQSLTVVEFNLPSLQTDLLGSLLCLLQYKSFQHKQDDRLRLLKLMCRFLHQTTYQIHPEGQNNEQINVRIKPHVVAVCLMEELISGLQRACADPESWLCVLQQESIIPLLLSSLAQWVTARQGIQYVEAVVMLFQSLAKIQKSAESLCVNGFTKHLCLTVSQLYSEDTNLLVNRTETTIGNDSQPTTTWLSIYRHFISLEATMITTLRHNFITDAIDFIGVHHERMIKCLNCVRLSLYPCRLLEARAVCHFIYTLCLYQRQWRLQLPRVMEALLGSMSKLVQTCVSLLIRPQFLQLLLTRHTNASETTIRLADVSGTGGTSTHLTTLRLHSQSSSDDVEWTNQQLLETQHHLLMIVAEAISAYRKLSPNLCEILLDQSLDISEYDHLVMLSFTTPSVDQESFVSFGTLISLLTWCTTMLTKRAGKSEGKKVHQSLLVVYPLCLNSDVQLLVERSIEPRGLSPAKSPTPIDLGPITKSLLLFVLENTLVVVMAQSAKLLRDLSSTARDRQYLKRELSAELNTFLQTFQRSFRKTAPVSPSSSSLTPSPQLSRSSSQLLNDQLAYRVVSSFVDQVLR